jgi:hypothetical protein
MYGLAAHVLTTQRWHYGVRREGDRTAGAGIFDKPCRWGSRWALKMLYLPALVSVRDAETDFFRMPHARWMG